MLKIKERKKSTDGSIKYLFEFPDRALAEAVKFEFNNEQCVCISTQIGCSVGCRFCASADYAFRRNITSDELVEEVKTVLLDNPDIKMFDEVAFQGTGEPLSNLENVSGGASRMLEAKLAKNFSLATSGNLRMFSLIKNTPVNKVYLSLHASTDDARTKLIPTNVATGVGKLVSLAKTHARETGVSVTINYLLLEGVNDSDSDINNLIKLLEPKFFQFQLIVLNKVVNSKNENLKASTKLTLFSSSLEKAGFSVRILHSKASDVDGGCGQMVSRFLN